MKWAVLTMDVEDWYHLDYFDRHQTDESASMLNGLDVFEQLMAEKQLPATFFVLGELATPLAYKLRQLHDQGHEIAAHGWDHRRPLLMSVDEFRDDVRRTKAELQAVVGRPVAGYRAPCFSLDRARLDVLMDEGYQYDSSRIDFTDHPLYGSIDLQQFAPAFEDIYRQGDFFEFEVTTARRYSRQMPISGGGYLRIFPWTVMGRWVRQYVAEHEFYVLYIHPFELSRSVAPRLPAGASWRTRMRFNLGRRTVVNKLHKLIALLQRHNFNITTMGDLRARLLAADPSRQESSLQCA